MGIADVFADRFTSHQVNLERFTAGQIPRVLQLVRGVETEIVDLLKKNDPTGPRLTVFRRQRATRTLDAARKIIDQGFRNVHRDQRRELRDLYNFTLDQTVNTMNEVIGVDLLSVDIPPARIRALTDDVLVMGRPAVEWWTQNATNQMFDIFRSTVNQGVFVGKPINEMVRELVGTRRAGFRDGRLAITRRSAESLVRTSVLSTANAAREEALKNNDDLIDGVQALVTLDLRTTDICIARSGGAWDLETRQPLPQSTRDEPYPGPPPWHFRCRTSLIPILVPFSALSRSPKIQRSIRRQTRRIDETTRASIDGQVAADLTYSDWLRNQSRARQVQALGERRWRLWQDGRIKLSELIDQTGRPLTLEQLRQL